jgi:protein involved in polysaccharide export with SLBB domain
MRWLISFLLTVLIAASVAAQQEPPRPVNPVRQPPADPKPDLPKAEAPPPKRASNVIISTNEDYKIGVGDVLDIRVADAEELSGQRRVFADGMIKLPFLGRLVAIEKTSEQLAAEIVKGLEGKYLFEPRVSVDVMEYNSRMIYLQGAVNRPGVYSAEGKPDLLQLIAIGGGLLPNHSSTAFVIRRNKLTVEDIKAREAELKQEAADVAADPDQPRLKDAQWLAKQYTMVRLKIAGLYKGNFDQNMYLEPNDIVTIPPTDLFFVSGAVKAPGSFQLKDGTTFRQAIALSQGMIPQANPGGTIIFRENPETGKRLELRVDAGKIMSGKEEDIPIYPNDVIIVPNSKWKTVVYPLANIMAYSIITTVMMQAFY